MPYERIRFEFRRALVLLFFKIFFLSILFLQLKPNAVLGQQGLDIHGRITTSRAASEVFGEAVRRYGFNRPSDRARIPGSIQLSVGLQIHPLCLRRTVSRLSRQQMEEEFNAAITAAVSDMSNCQDRYSELAPYVEEWMNQLRNTVILCTTNFFAPDAWHSPTLAAMHSALTAEERRAIAGLEHSDEKFRAVIGINRRGFFLLERARAENAGAQNLASSFLTGVARSILRDTTIHEITHATIANNRFDHNHIETVGPGRAGGCGADITMDRVNVITALCSATESGFGAYGVGRDTVQVAMLRRMEDCHSIDIACTSLFTRAGNNLRGHSLNRTTDLEPAAALNLCAKIRDDGQCLMDRRRYTFAQDAWYSRHQRTHPGNITVTRADRENPNDPFPYDQFLRDQPNLVNFSNTLRQRFLEVLPAAENQIPAGMLAAWPDLQERVNRLNNSSCFHSIFNRNEAGSLYLNNYALSLSPPNSANPRGILNPGMHFVDRAQFDFSMTKIPNTPLENHFSRFVTSLGAATNLAPRCQSDPHRDEIRNVINELSLRAGAASKFPLFRSALRRSTGLAEESSDLVREYYRASETRDDGASNIDLFGRQLLGQDNFQNYLNTLDRYHPASAHYQCEGSSPTRAAQRSNELQTTVRQFANPTPPPCP